MLSVCKTAADSPGVGLKMDLALLVGCSAYLAARLRDSADIPLAVPELTLTGFLDFCLHLCEMTDPVSMTRLGKEAYELISCPVVQE